MSLVHIPVVFVPTVMSSVPKDSPTPPPLQVCNRPQTSHRPPGDSLLLLDPLPLPASIVELGLPIVIRKGIHSTRIPSPHYIALSYHQLSQSFILAFRLFLLCPFQSRLVMP